MKSRISIALVMIIAVFSSMTLTAKNSKTFSDFYHQFKDEEASIAMNLSGGFLNLFAELDEDFKDLKNDIDNIKMLVLQSENDPKKWHQTIADYLPKSDYHDLMLIQDGKDEIVVKFREVDQEEGEVIFLVKGEESLFALSLSGQFDAKKAKKMVKSIKLKDHQ